MRATIIPLLAATLVAKVISVDSPIPGYGVEEFTWYVKTSPGGHTYSLNGTVQEVYAQLQKINPDFQLPTGTVLPKRDDKRSSLKKRDRVLCGNFPLAEKRRIQQGITYLRKLNGAPRNGPGPGNCGRVSCSYNAAIWWCNDNTTPKTLNSWNNIADSAQLIINNCASSASDVSGQDFHQDNWNGIVRRDSC